MRHILTGSLLLTALMVCAGPLPGQAPLKPAAPIFTPDGQRLIMAQGNAITVVEAQTQKVLILIQGHTDLVAALAVSPDGKIFASGSADKSIRLFDQATGKELRRFQVAAAVIGLSFSQDGKNLSSREADKTTKLWDVSSGQLIQTTQQK